MDTLNKELILKVADEIEAMPHGKYGRKLEVIEPGFNMSQWRREGACGTICCIGGHVSPSGWYQGVAEAFNITEDDAHDLCFPSFRQYYDITPARAARVLRHLAHTGKVDWSVASEPA